MNGQFGTCHTPLSYLLMILKREEKEKEINVVQFWTRDQTVFGLFEQHSLLLHNLIRLEIYRTHQIGINSEHNLKL